MRINYIPANPYRLYKVESMPDGVYSVERVKVYSGELIKCLVTTLLVKNSRGWWLVGQDASEERISRIIGCGGYNPWILSHKFQEAYAKRIR